MGHSSSSPAQPPCSRRSECPVVYRYSKINARSASERLAKPKVLVQVKVLGTDGARDAEIGEFAVHLGLGKPARGQTGEGAAEVFSAMDVQIAEEVAEAPHVSDIRSACGVRADLHDGRINLRSRPEGGRRDAPDDRDLRKALHHH